MISRRRRQHCLERSKKLVTNEVSTCDHVFLDHFRWANDYVGTSGRGLEVVNINGLLKWLLDTDELEIFVLCLIHFGWYSVAHSLFNDLDLDRLSQQHKNLTSKSSSIASIGSLNNIGYDLPDDVFLCSNSSSLQKHRHLILCKLDGRPVFGYMKANNLLKECRSQFNTSGQELTAQLLEFIESGDPRLVTYFHHSLLLSGQFELFAFLVDLGTDWESLNSLGTRKRLQLINEWKQQRENLAPKKNLSFERSTLNEEDDSQSFDFSVDFPDTNTAKNLKYYTDDRVNIYKNFSVPKGLVLLINNENFQCELSPRNGTARDEENLYKLFSELGYTIDVQRDLTGMEMLSRARTFSKNPVHAEADSCVVIVLTHGEEDTLIGTDGNHINIHDFLDFFNSKNAPLLAGKPKIFIIQACRGSTYDEGIRYPVPLDEIDFPQIDRPDQSFINSIFSKMGFNSSSPQRKSSRSQQKSTSPAESVRLTTRKSVELHGSLIVQDFDPTRYKLVKHPIMADILIAYATVPRYVSWRNSQRGTWYVQSICKVFAERAQHDDILTLLTKVHLMVAKNESTEGSGSKQIPEITSRFQKKFYFFPRIVTDE